MTCEGENGTSGSHLPVFSEDIALPCHLVASHSPHSLQPYSSASDIGYTYKQYLKYLEIQLAVRCTVDTVNYLE